VINPEALDADTLLENQIAFQAGLVATSNTRDEKVAAVEELKRLIALRSPAQIERMERKILR
jgi:hypothetical protein